MEPLLFRINYEIRVNPFFVDLLICEKSARIQPRYTCPLTHTLHVTSSSIKLEKQLKINLIVFIVVKYRHALVANVCRYTRPPISY